MEPIRDNSILIGTDVGDFFIYDGKNITKFDTTAKEYLKKYHLYCGASLGNGLYAIGTRLGGVGIMI